jgi:hypothetical protein
MCAPRGRVDRGETLIESLLSLMFVSIVITVILAGIAVSSELSGDHRKFTVSDVAVKTAAETLQRTTYILGACGATAVSGCSTQYTAPTVPSGYTVTIESVKCWPAGASTSYDVSTFPNCTTSNDNGLQVLRIITRSTDGHAQEVTQLMKRKP